MPKKTQPKKKVLSPKKEKATSSSTRWKAFDYKPGALQPLNDQGWPWRDLKFKKAPKALRIQDGWTATAEFTFPFIPRTVVDTYQEPWGPVTVQQVGKMEHRWESIGITMSKGGWELWGKLHPQDRMEILESLAYWPVKNQFFEGGNKSRGDHDLIEEICMHNSRWAGSLFLFWAKTAPATDSLKIRVVGKMKAEGFLEYTPHDLFAYLTKLNWEVGAPHMGAPPEWPLKTDPTRDPHGFFKALIRDSPYHPNEPGKPMQEIEKMIENLFAEKGPTLHYPPGAFVSAPSGFPHSFSPRKPHSL